MNVLVRIPTPLRTLTNGQGDLHVEAATVKEMFDQIEKDFTGLKGRLRGDDGTVLRFINVYVNEEDIRFLHGMSTGLKPGDEVSIVPAMAGGVSPDYSRTPSRIIRRMTNSQ